MFYFKFTAETPYCGTDVEEYRKFTTRPTDAELNEIAESMKQDNAESYEYLVSGWDDENFEGMSEEERQEELDNYYADCYGGWVEISKEEYEENT